MIVSSTWTNLNSGSLAPIAETFWFQTGMLLLVSAHLRNHGKRPKNCAGCLMASGALEQWTFKGSEMSLTILQNENSNNPNFIKQQVWTMCFIYWSHNKNEQWISPAKYSVDFFVELPTVIPESLSWLVTSKLDSINAKTLDSLAIKKKHSKLQK